MKKFLIASTAIALSTLAACGVDKEGSADNLIKELKDAGIEVDADAEKCIKDVVEDYSDDELTSLSEGTADADLEADFGGKLIGCGIGG